MNKREPYNFFYTKEREKPYIRIPDEQLVERGPCRWCGLDKFMGRRNAEYCSLECQKLGKARSEQRAQARLKQRREKAKITAPAVEDPDVGLSFLQRRMRQLEAEGKLDNV